MGKIEQTKKYDNGTAYLMLSPIVILLTSFVAVPFVYAIYISFYNWGFYQDSVFVGWRNFYLVLTDQLFWHSIVVGLKFALYVIPLQMLLSFLFAHVIRAMGRRSSGIVKTSIYIPTVISGIIASIIFGFIYHYDGGIANYLIGLIGIEKIAWLNDVSTALPSLAVPAIWLGFGISALIMLAGLLDIPDSYYEAADMEGANAFQKMIYITIPLMKNVILFLLVTGFAGALQQLELPMIMTGGGPVNATLTPNLHIFNHFRNDVEMGYTIAAALLMFVVLGSIAAFIFRILNSDKAIDG
ncbi:carbohydrate ABC transporter permease [Desmospora activa]|uniref:Multiple sugar transport system permease protein n=1 Tax=Desmospora activa DSM 45169 TaxID=1121389 RepID=A0A2T4ZD44_9BACL|nr:sugar ABC transporter permease [Desmospora activa]PTM59800.1 multiple sugar transport system permease protein [Desmospora activa DSM 45169]